MQEQVYWEKAFDELPDAISFHTLDRRIVKANKAALKYLNKSSGEVLGCHCFNLFANRLKPCLDCPIEKVLIDHKSHTKEVYFQGQYLLVTVAPIFEDHKIIGVIHATKDITPRIYAEEKYRTVVENMTDGVVITDRKLNLLFFNKSFERISGYTNGELKDLKLQDLLVPASYELVIFKHSETKLSDNISFKLRLTGIHKDRSLIHIITSSRIFHKNTITVVSDLTELLIKDKEIQTLRNRIRVGEILLEHGYITTDQLKEALKEKNRRVGEILIDRGFIDGLTLNFALEKQKVLNEK